MTAHIICSRSLSTALALLTLGMPALCIVRAADPPARPQAPTVLVPAAGEPAYRIAGDAFADLWHQATGTRPTVVRCAAPGDGKLPAGDLVLVGSDSVNPVVHRLILQSRIEGLGLRCGTDDYRMLSLADGARTLLLLAGATGRSTLYAIYDFFRERAGAEYFWDGDVVPRRARIELGGCDFARRPRFAHRGLRYFAHRGPHRFHAELWDLEDWKREIDWMVKKRLNLFMLRTGIDDLFYRAFPELPYPPEDGVDPDAEPRSYNDRTSFWPLRYRGELRRAILAYARERGLVHPEDTGTITHWYSHTPGSFYRAYPDFPVTRDQKTGYSLASAAIWDIEYERTWDAYWRLTETHIREFGEPRMFHTIGLAERRFGADEREDLQRKLHAYRKIQEVLRRHHPEAPLLIASWDLMGWWKDAAVRGLLGEFDARRTILLDYTADLLDRKTYIDWDVTGRFPWIFGVFQAFAGDSDVRGEFSLLQERIGEAARDPQCLGLVLWPEISHANTLLLEYLADNGWDPARLDVNRFLPRFCAGRYPARLAVPTERLWQSFLPIAATHHFTHRSANQPATRTAVQADPHFRILTNADYTNLTEQRLRQHDDEARRLAPALRAAPALLDELSRLAPQGFPDEHWRRDAIDMVRTVINRALKLSLIRACQAMEAWRQGRGDAAPVHALETINKELMRRLGDALALSDEYSLSATLKRLGQARPLHGVSPRLNPQSEATLKANSENNYCRGAHQYELVRHVYTAELDEYWKWVDATLDAGQKKAWARPATFAQVKQTIQDRFYATPLAELAPTRTRSAEALAETIAGTRQLLTTLATAER